MDSKLYNRTRVKYRIRKKVSGVSQKPRLSVFRSNKEIYCQLIDDVNGVTIAAASSKGLKVAGTKITVAAEVGKILASKAKAAGIEKIVFDRGGYLYHGRVKSLADGAREGGLIF
ncbi:MAG: 50S ribosomal protein L18 [Saprospiraceae bacterium]|jgi:large subunit ribosomal protein L18|nr:50S ribosomal protein L18 [Saprospiraceae bacterium]MBK8055461.1 50S ribosomal protein L18 [Saprospiraceae bacterium]MBK9565928.1 50S ribosomal protein L18 [Saprospiraceae bacterium]MBP6445571.1 50S ribosomal protein L18 [Saprospiraceae bacterium]